MKSTMVLRTDTSGRTLWVDIGWQACDERLVTVAEAKALRVGGAPQSAGQWLAAGYRSHVHSPCVPGMFEQLLKAT